ncbi:MAG: SDR family NAD(P)-dependent oxidoreductase [Clostridia bacterium]|nr:SDR family NAD(P)-dependent oxidoreductase [Clostridia bacterium]
MNIVITGASDGIGASAARQLKALGHNVILVGRNREKTARIAKELDAPYHLADYARLSDVARLAEELNGYERIDVLANNVGGMLSDRILTEDGNEQTFQVNVLGAFLLTNLLMDKLSSSRAKVIQTSSIAANLFSKEFDIDDLQNERGISPIHTYGNTKLCNVLFTRELNRRYGDKISAVAFEPGIVRSNFASESSPFFKIAYHSFLKYLFTISPERSAKRLVRLVTEPFECGEVYGNGKKYKIRLQDDGSLAASLWERCERLTERFVK